MANPAETKRKSSWSTPLLLLSFALVFLILFNNDLRILTGQWVGYAFTPLIGFNHQYPILTIFLASTILVIGTTVIRHFLVDWSKMARSQEAMRAFQKEFAEARKANNTYKMKRLTEAQPKIFELQADLQKDQLKPMAFTMLLVIPIFAWVGVYIADPVDFELTDAPETPVVVVGKHAEHVRAAFLASSQAEGQTVLTTAGDLYGYALLPPGTTVSADAAPVRVRTTDTNNEFLVHLAGAPAVPDGARIGELAAGTYGFTIVPHTPEARMTLTGAPAPYHVDSALILVMQDGRPVHAVAASWETVTLTLAAASEVYAVIPEGLDGGEIQGEATLRVTGDATQDYMLTEANVVALDPATLAAPIYPYSGKLPWQSPWSLQDFWWILPHWILLYSLFGIPFGQIAQRALKLWEYRNVDLDGDGRKAGESS